MRKKKIEKYILNISKIYSISPYNLILNFINYIIQNNTININSTFLTFIENIIHQTNVNEEIFLRYFIEFMYSNIYN